MNEEWLTLLLGGNLASDFKLKPLLVYQSENLRAFKGIGKAALPVFWKANKKAWIMSVPFLDRFLNHFVPEAELLHL